MDSILGFLGSKDKVGFVGRLIYPSLFDGGAAVNDRKGSERDDSSGLSSECLSLSPPIDSTTVTRYRNLAKSLQSRSDGFFLYEFMMWCVEVGLYIHPALRGSRRNSEMRDHAFYVAERVPRLTPLVAIPESCLIGFKRILIGNEKLEAMESNAVCEATREVEFNRLNAGEGEAADICAFFFSSLNMMISDLVSVRGSRLTDRRYPFAEALSKVRSIHNAPYFSPETVMDARGGGATDEPSLADVHLQMIRNYVNAGPLVNKVPAADLLWLTSICLSHSTPLSIGQQDSIGMVPLVHLFPHGGKQTNSFLVSRHGKRSMEFLATFFQHHCGIDFSVSKEDYVFLVTDQVLAEGQEVCVQSMAPVCDSDVEAEQMWRLSCGSVPHDFLLSAEVERKRRQLEAEMVEKGSALIREKKREAS